MKTKEIIYVSGAYVPAAGGAEQTMHTLMVQLQKTGYNPTVLTRRELGQPGQESIDGVEVTRIPSLSLEQTLLERIENVSPGVIFTQLMWCDRAIKMCQQTGVPSVYFVRSPGGNLDISRGGEYEVDEVVSNSVVTQQFIKDKWRRDSTIMYPLVDYDRYLIEDPDPKVIAMVNPAAPKGGRIFREIAQNLPERTFLAAQGWDFLRDKSGHGWDMQKMQEMADAHRDTLHIPDDVNLSGLPNLTVAGPYRDMREFYRQTRILLMPSLWEEAFGRSAVEAMVNGIPVIASRRGNLANTVDSGGLIVDDPEDISAWISAISKLDSPEVYAKYSVQARRSAARFSMQSEMDKVLKLLEIIP